MLTDTRHSPYAKMQSLPIRAVRWTSGFWAEKFQTCRRTMIPHMWDLLDDAVVSHNVTNFRIAAGHEEGEHCGPPFGDGDLYKWLEAASFMLGATDDAELGRLTDDVISLIGGVQREDGYIFTQHAIATRNDPGSAEPLSNQLNFEVYNLGHLMTAGCVHHRATGKRTLLAVAEKAAAYLERTFAELSPENAKTAVCPSHYMGTVELYRTTGNQRYLELARKLIRMRDLVKNGTDDNQDRIPLADQRKAIGHAVRANYLYAGVADLFAETGEARYLEVLESCWDNVVHQKMYITGSCGALYDGVSPYGSSNYAEVQRTHQAYGREYELPNITAYNETCAAIGNILWNWRILNITGESRFADIIELVMYNGALAGISLDGTKYFYVNALRRNESLPFALRWSRTREPYISSFCCPPNLVRTIAESSSYAYAVSEDSVYVILFGGNLAEFALDCGARLVLSQSTEYPWDGTVDFRIEELSGERRFTLNLRIPGWASTASVTVNGEPYGTDASPGQFFGIDREWVSGDEVCLVIPMPVRMMEAHPLVEETRNHVAFQRGPVVYCLESADLPADIPIADIYVPRQVRWSEDRDFAVGSEKMVTLRGSLLRRVAAPWNGELYRPVKENHFEAVQARLLPYYAWDNRGFGEMTVWLPLGLQAEAPGPLTT